MKHSVAAKDGFQGDEEWRSILPDTLKADQQRGRASQGRASHLGELIDRAFNEVARSPGFLANARALVGSHTTDGAIRQQLVHRIAGCRTALGDLETQLSVGTYQPDFLGPISVPVAKLLVQFSCEGIEVARALLQQLLIVLESNPSRGTAIPAPLEGDDSLTSPEMSTPDELHRIRPIVGTSKKVSLTRSHTYGYNGTV